MKEKVVLSCSSSAVDKSREVNTTKKYCRMSFDSTAEPSVD